MSRKMKPRDFVEMGVLMALLFTAAIFTPYVVNWFVRL